MDAYFGDAYFEDAELKNEENFAKIFITLSRIELRLSIFLFLSFFFLLPSLFSFSFGASTILYFKNSVQTLNSYLSAKISLFSLNSKFNHLGANFDKYFLISVVSHTYAMLTFKTLLLFSVSSLIKADNELFNSWSNGAEEMSPFVWPFKNQYASFLVNISELESLSQECARDLKILSNGIKNNRFWAFECKFRKINNDNNN